MSNDASVDTFRKAGGRLSEAMDANLQRVSYPGPWESIHHELPAVHMFDKAHCLMLVEEAIIPREIGRQILAGFREMERGDVLEARRSVGGSHHSGERWLTGRYGEEIGGWLHVGRSSGDLGAVADSITARDKILKVWERVLALREVLLTQAAGNLDTVMPGYSGAQHAQPITFGFYLHSWEEAVRRDTERLQHVYHRVNRSPAGAAIMTGSDFGLNRHRVAELLGFDQLRTNCHDAIFHLDHLVEAACVFVLLMTNAGRLADDLHLWATNEFAMVAVPDRYCVTSSIMPQKKNPWATVFIRGQLARALGRLSSILTLFKGRQDEFDAATFAPWELWEMVDGGLLALEFLAEMITLLEVRRGLMQQRAGAFWATATDLASALVREKRLPWRTAHQIVAILVRTCQDRGVKPQDVTPEMVDEAAVVHSGRPVELSAEAIRKALDPVHFVEARTMVGGPAPRTLARQLAESARILASDRAAHAEAQERLRRASRALEAGIDAVLA